MFKYAVLFTEPGDTASSCNYSMTPTFRFGPP
jgi:hypothetical protein